MKNNSILLLLHLISTFAFAQLGDSLDISIKLKINDKTKIIQSKYDPNTIIAYQNQSYIPQAFHIKDRYFIPYYLNLMKNKQGQFLDYIYMMFSPNFNMNKKIPFTYAQENIDASKDWLNFSYYQYDSIGNYQKYYSNNNHSIQLTFKSLKNNILKLHINGKWQAYNAQGQAIADELVNFSADVMCRLIPFDKDVVLAYKQNPNNTQTDPFESNLNEDEKILFQILQGRKSVEIEVVEKIYQKNLKNKNNISALSAAILLVYKPNDPKISKEKKLKYTDYLLNKTLEPAKKYSLYYTDIYYIDNFKNSIDMFQYYINANQYEKALKYLQSKYPEKTDACMVSFYNYSVEPNAIADIYATIHPQYILCFEKLHQTEKIWNYILIYGLFWDKSLIEMTYFEKIKSIIHQKFTSEERKMILQEMVTQIETMKSEKYIGKFPKINFQNNRFCLVSDSYNNYTHTYNELPELFKNSVFYQLFHSKN